MGKPQRHTIIVRMQKLRALSLIKFSQRFNEFLHRYVPNCGNMPDLAMLKNPFKNS